MIHRMGRVLDPKRIELLHERVAEALRTKTPAQRLMMAFEANHTARLLIEGSLRSRYPDWSDGQVRREIARRMLGTD